MTLTEDNRQKGSVSAIGELLINVTVQIILEEEPTQLVKPSGVYRRRDAVRAHIAIPSAQIIQRGGLAFILRLHRQQVW